MRWRFLQFGVRQYLLLIAVLSLLLAIMAPRLQDAYRSRQLGLEYRRLQDATRNLATAVRSSDAELARRALEAGASANVHHGDGSLLRHCIDNGQIPLVELLLDFGADIERVERLQSSLVVDGPPLYAAVGCSQPTEVRQEMARLLIQHGADVRMRIGRLDLMDLAVYRSDPEMADFLKGHGLPYGAREMAAFNQLEQLQRLVAENPGVLRERSKPIFTNRPERGPTLLGMALWKGHREVAMFLIDQGAPLDTVEGQGQTLLHQAVRGGDPELILLLVTHGLDVNAKDDYEDTPLTDRVWDAPPEAISALIKAGADMNSCRFDGRTALHLAVANGRIDVIPMLLAAGADPSIPDRDGMTALDEARAKDPKIANMLTSGMSTITRSLD